MCLLTKIIFKSGGFRHKTAGQICAVRRYFTERRRSAARYPREPTRNPSGVGRPPPNSPIVAVHQQQLTAVVVEVDRRPVPHLFDGDERVQRQRAQVILRVAVHEHDVSGLSLVKLQPYQLGTLVRWVCQAYTASVRDPRTFGLPSIHCISSRPSYVGVC